MKMRGIYEKHPGSGVWWVRYVDAQGRLRREKAGTKRTARDLYHKRKQEALEGRKLPEKFRRRSILFRELCEDAILYARTHHRNENALVVRGKEKIDYRAPVLIELFGNRQADCLSPQELERGLTNVARQRSWSAASFNRHKAFISLAYRLGSEHGKVSTNPARLVRRHREENGRIRWLTTEEEAKLRAIIASRYLDQLPAFDLALHTGMRRSEQYQLRWECVDFERRQLTILYSKHGGTRYIYLDDTAMRALRVLKQRASTSSHVMVLAKGSHGYSQGHALKTPREWFTSACQLAGLTDFRWHDIRHTFASRLVMVGVGLRDVQELMGHKTIAMTCRYSHLAPSHQLEAVRKLDAWGRKPASSEERTDTKTGTGILKTDQANITRTREALM